MKKVLFLYVVVAIIFSSCTLNRSAVQKKFSTDKYNLEMDYYKDVSKDGADEGFLTYKFKADMALLAENYKEEYETARFTDDLINKLILVGSIVGSAIFVVYYPWPIGYLY